MLRPVQPFLLSRFREIEQVSYQRLALRTRGKRRVLLLAREEGLLQKIEARARKRNVEEEVIAEDHGAADQFTVKVKEGGQGGGGEAGSMQARI